MRFLDLALFASLATAASLPLSVKDFTTVKHEAHPEHKILLKHNGVGLDEQKSDTSALTSVCPGATPGYTGYLVSGTKHFFFAYFQSRSSPTTDPVVLWTNGGPGCSGFIGLLQEHGPCQIKEDNTTVKNDYSWVDSANMIYVEQPLGVGFSFDSSNATTIGSTWMAADDIVIFLKLWYSHFPEHKKNDFHLSGESYAGHYLPIFAKTLLKHNEAAQPEDKIPLKSVIIGNGQYDRTIQDATVYNMTCTDANGIGPLISDDECNVMNIVTPTCRDLQQRCQTTLSDDQCDPAMVLCSPFGLTMYQHSNRSVYDVKWVCKDAECDPLSIPLTTFFNSPRVRNAFGANEPSVDQWEACNFSLYGQFMMTNDIFDQSATILRELLDQGLKFLIFTGMDDVICNYLGVELVLKGMPWHGQEAMNQAALKPKHWIGGEYWEADNLRYARVNDAGHFVPRSQPAAALELFQAWLDNRAMK